MRIPRYSLRFDVNFENLSFSATETVTFRGAPRTVELDCENLNIGKVTSGRKDLKWEMRKRERKLRIRTPGKGDFSCRIEFTGKVRDGELQGFYKSRYKEGYILTTQFEPLGARSLFPCIDSPEIKSVFEISVVVDKGLSVISNTEIASKTESNGRVEFNFAPTPKMATYLLYIGIGKFTESSASEGGIKVIIASTPDQKGKGRFALRNALKLLKTYEKYYSIPYPLSKLHLVGIPEYSVGAMENWGSITFRESVLFVDEDTSENSRRTVASVLAHEIAHQWFGNLVTMRWWNDLWLNESFATFMSTKILDSLYPGWDVWSDFLLYETGPSMTWDALMSTHPIEAEVKRPEDISEIFDEISYGKGGSVLRMINEYLGEEYFRNGIRNYLKRFSYENAVSSDLWKSLGTSSGTNVESIMRSWVRKAGHPVVVVSRTGSRVRLSQRRFLLSGKSEEDIWPIPLTYLDGGKRKTLLMNRKNAYADINDIDDFVMNEEGSGFYRVLYDEASYGRLYSRLEELRNTCRWHLLSDMYAFLYSGDVDFHLYMKFASKLSDDADYLVISELNSQLNELLSVVPDIEELSSLYCSFCRKHLKRVGYRRRNGEDRINTIVREKLSSGLALVDERYAAEIAPLFKEWEKTEAELKGAAVIAYARTRGMVAFEEISGKMKSAESDQNAMKLSMALVSFREGNAVRRGLDLSFTGELNIGHLPYVFIAASRNPEGRKEMWEFFTSNRDRIIKTFRGTGLNSLILERIIANCGVLLGNEITEYLSNHDIPEASAGVRKGLEIMSVRRKLAERIRRSEENIGRLAG
ncbi:MAG: M1 family metallopeptidase [Thermoplasmata archaeon]|uniref:Aminopeptidase n=1 Tax=Candidatus Sysuiplasma superficiale TaxID=2823368 RepID=A0A8J8CCW2_9ARCH|nr:M1 family metallopeptidase [Candidatus Sysuiplasma superficiale]MBX8643765.1 M1 family metallopeptidase [Candidatus Sysuiplasma superficiale]MCL4347283.1 M1 family metallopeptidase [Candidatus Thermoplasmatota archaeon]MCL5437202.1 M1 family metallopeptidase [Candidatus Thermoplasmatota archaeon]